MTHSTKSSTVLPAKTSFQWLSQKLLCYFNIVDNDCKSKHCLSSVQIVITKYHRLGSLQTTEIYFSRFWKLEDQDQGVSMVKESLHRAEVARDLSGISFVEALIPFLRALWLSSLPTAPLPHTITLGLTILTCDFRGNTWLDHSTHSTQGNENDNFWLYEICHLEFYCVNLKQHIFQAYLLLNSFFFFFENWLENLYIFLFSFTEA